MSFSFSEPIDIYDEIEAASAQRWQDEADEACLHAAFEACYEAAADEGCDVSRADFAFTAADERYIVEQCPWWDDMTWGEQGAAIRSWARRS